MTMNYTPLLLISLLLLSGCTAVSPPGTVPTQPTTAADVSFTSFSNMDDLETFLLQNAANSYGGYYYRGLGSVAMVQEDMMALGESSAPQVKVAMATDGAGSTVDFSQTNNQVASIDEADIIKTDGKYIYTLSGQVLSIVDAYPGDDAHVVSEIVFEHHPQSLFIANDVLVVIGQVYNHELFADMPRRGGMLFVFTYDVSDREQPVLDEELFLEGSYLEGRLYDDVVYVISTSQPQYDPIYPAPIIMRDDAVKMVALDDIYVLPRPYSYAQFTNIFALSLDDYELQSTTLTLDGQPTLYMSEDTIVLGSTRWINEEEIMMQVARQMLMPHLSSRDKDLIQKIEATDDAVLSKQEKQYKTMEVLQGSLRYLDETTRDTLEEDMEDALEERMLEFISREYTSLYTLDVSTLSLTASGEVPGSLLNQFSLDEYKGVLRVATTINPPYHAKESKMRNVLYTLDEDLEVLDSIDDLGIDERIYSVRYMGDRVYMVTFKQIDPFYVIDASNPSDLVVLGELKIPGFSRYLHPYDENVIIGLGRDADRQGRQEGLKISLFDVSDVANPIEIAQFVTEEDYAQSTAEYEHKAFLFSKEKELLVIPAYSRSWENGKSLEHYNGAMVFHISSDDITLRGIVDHSSGQDAWGSLVERSLYIEDMLYTKSQGLLRINALEDLSSVARIELKSASTQYPVY